jgi:thiol-disulfide isomerase/thioredoxin
VSEARRIIANPVRAREPFAPDFSFTTREGVTVSNATLQGKVVLLDFWATWCGPCREAVPMLLQIRKKYLNRPFQIVGISSDDNTQAWANFIASHHLDWSEYIDLSGQVQHVFDVDEFPTFVVLDGNGIIRFRQSGTTELTQEEMEDAINKALKRPLQPSPAPAASTAPAPAQSGVLPGQNPAPPQTDKTIEGSSAGTTGVETSTISGDVYRNRFLGFSYEFPPGWIAAKPEGLRAANESIAASAKAFALQQHPESGGTPHIMVPKIIFYASRRGEGDGQRFVIPSLRITAMEWSLPELTLDTVKRDAERMEGAGMNLVRSPEEYSIGEQQLFRTDFENTRTNPHSWMCYIQTVVEGYLLTLEIFAADKQELEQLAPTTQSLSFHTP